MSTPETQLALTADDKASLWNQAQSLAVGANDLLPERWRNKPQAVFQMMMQARELGIEPIAACRLTYLVHGQPCLKTEAVIGLINKHAGMASELMFEERGELPGDSYGVRCYAISSRSGERLDSIWVGPAMAREQGWSTKKQNKYQGPFAAQMYRYRAAGFWARLYAPEVMMGMYTVQERQELREAAPQPQLTGAAAKLNDVLAGKAKPEPEPQDEAEEAQFQEVEGDPLKERGEDLKEQWAKAAEVKEPYDNENLFDNAPEAQEDPA